MLQLPLERTCLALQASTSKTKRCLLLDAVAFHA